MADELTRRRQGMFSNPHIANMVRKIRIVLTRRDAQKVFPPFTQCLSACTNLHTLHIAFAPVVKFRGLFKRALTVGSSASDRRYLQFPSIQTIILPTTAYYFLRCCPNAREIVCLGNFEYGKQVIAAIRAACPKVEVLTGVQLEGPNVKNEKMSEEEKDADGILIMKKLVKAAPKLRELRFLTPFSDSQLIWLSNLKQLRLVELITSNPDKENVEEHMSSMFKILNDELGWSICVPTGDTVDSLVVADSETRKRTLVVSYKPKFVPWWKRSRRSDESDVEPELWTRAFTLYSTAAAQQPESRKRKARSRNCKEKSLS
ncbi:hypothetical protein EST38_g12326 [Candolleomyces aberdarensis]|uniref:F-box domain-containing protein n=1 Tax=Candolleomyces aberdarensis TaxID=2316362 RepID=A0A4Q2D5A7_9AGAR|nr:hypothetical protein EST38_g12326 [Candolleomyces aberdarensis]